MKTLAVLHFSLIYLFRYIFHISIDVSFPPFRPFVAPYEIHVARCVLNLLVLAGRLRASSSVEIRLCCCRVAQVFTLTDALSI